MTRGRLATPLRSDRAAPAVVVALLLQAGCSSGPPPVLEPVRGLDRRPPVIVVPGITGSKLRQREGGRILWGRGRDLLLPRDGGYELALRPEVAAGEAAPRLEAFEVIERIRLGLLGRGIYASVVRVLEANGYRLGELGDPRSGDSLFLYDWDWRRSHVRAARRLVAELERLRRRRGEERLEVDLVCQSAGGRICRYAAKFGAAPLVAAAAGRARPSDRIRVRTVVLVGTSSGGSLRVLRELDRGRRYVPVVGRRWLPEVLFTFTSLFEDLPAYRRDLFVDTRGRPLDVDLFDPESWRRYGWSIFADDVRKRLTAEARPDLFGDARGQLERLGRALRRARLLHRALQLDVAGFATVYASIQGTGDPTPVRAVLARAADGSRRTLFAGDPALGRLQVPADALVTEGDGHATTASQDWLSDQERRSLVAELRLPGGGHFEMILDRRAHRWILEVLSGSGPP